MEFRQWAVRISSPSGVAPSLPEYSSSTFVQQGTHAAMSMIRHSIEVSYDLRVFFTEHVFASDNLTLHNSLLSGTERTAPKILVVLDEAVAKSQPALLHEIPAYFAAHPSSL